MYLLHIALGLFAVEVFLRGSVPPETSACSLECFSFSYIHNKSCACICITLTGVEIMSSKGWTQPFCVCKDIWYSGRSFFCSMWDLNANKRKCQPVKESGLGVVFEQYLELCLSQICQEVSSQANLLSIRTDKHVLIPQQQKDSGEQRVSLPIIQGGATVSHNTGCQRRGGGVGRQLGSSHSHGQPIGIKDRRWWVHAVHLLSH